LNYQKAVKLKKLVDETMKAIDPAAKMNCDNLRIKPRTVPGVPGKSFIFLSQMVQTLASTFHSNKDKLVMICKYWNLGLA